MALIFIFLFLEAITLGTFCLGVGLRVSHAAMLAFKGAAYDWVAASRSKYGRIGRLVCTNTPMCNGC